VNEVPKERNAMNRRELLGAVGGMGAGMTLGGAHVFAHSHGKTADHEMMAPLGNHPSTSAASIAPRKTHWGIENSLHWQLDVTFQEDHSRVTRRNAAENLAMLRRLTLSLLHAHPAKLSIPKKRFAAALDPSFLEEILRGDGILEKA